MKPIESTLTKKQVFLSKLSTSIAILALGILILLATLGLFNAPAKSLIIPLTLLTLATLFITLAIIQQNTLLLWLFPILALASITISLNTFTTASLQKTYPLLILSPAIGSLLCALYSNIWKDHKKIILFLTPTATIFALHALKIATLPTTSAIFLIYLAITSLAHTIYKAKKIKGKTDND